MYCPTVAFHRFLFDDSIRVIAAFYVDRWLQYFDEGARVILLKEKCGIDHFEGADNEASVAFVLQGTIRALELAYDSIGVDPHQENVA